MATAKVTPPNVQKSMAKQQKYGKSAHVGLTGGSLNLGIRRRTMTSGSDSVDSSSIPDGMSGKGPSGAPANRKLLRSGTCGSGDPG